MNYIKSEKYQTPDLMKKIMGPNPLKLEEELMIDNSIKTGSIVMDLGSGQGITSVFLVKEYGFKVYATDLWSEPEENQKFFTEMGLTEEEIIAVKADTTDLKYEKAANISTIEANLENIEKRYDEIMEEITKPEVLSDVKKTREYSKEMASLEDIVNCYKRYKRVLEDIENTKEMTKDPELGEMAKEELKGLTKLQEEIKGIWDDLNENRRRD